MEDDFIIAYAAPQALGQSSPQPERLTIWLGTWRRIPPSGSEIRFFDLGGNPVHSPIRVPPATDSTFWETFGRAETNVGQGRFFSRNISNMPASSDTVTCQWRLLADDSLIATCQYRPIPSTLSPVSNDGQSPQPTTIMLSSCYWYDGAAPETLQDAMNSVDSKNLRPDIVAMIGDQVYIDQPPTEFLFEKTADDLEQFISLRYLNTWRQLRPILERGQHLHITDDHEYWNDYPFKPAPLWMALQNEPYRELMSDLTERAADLIQLHNMGGGPVGEIRLTENVSMFVADTRRTRSDRPARGFLDRTLFDLLLEWLNELNGPGILVLGQPIVHKPKGYFDTLDTLTDGFFDLMQHLLPLPLAALTELLEDLLTYISDRNLPWYAEQYITLLNALQNAAHDVLILAGDIHIGRVSQIWMLTHQGPPRKVYEVVSSPLRILPRAESVWMEETALTSIPTDPSNFEEQVIPGDDVSGTVQYLSAVPPQSGQSSQDHFMILQLYEGDVPGSLLTRITPFVLSDGPGDPEELPSIEITLDDGESQRGVIVTPKQIWLEAIVGEESAKDFAVTNYDDQPVSIKILPSLNPPFVWEARDLTLDPGAGFRHKVTYQPVALTTHESGPDSAILTIDLDGTSEAIGLLGVGLSGEAPPPRRSRRRRAR